MQSPAHYNRRPHPYARPARVVDTSAGGTNVFIYGLLGIMFCQILAPMAWLKGNEYMRTCASMGVEPSGLGVTGRVLGILGTLMAGLTVLVLAVAMLAH